ncbi:MAG: C1 family peptidase, partial [Pseudomonadota bacterium]
MAKASQPVAVPSLGPRILNVPRDATDLRDRMYEPSLLGLKLSMDPPDPELSPIRDQGGEGSCTGFALSSAITFLNRLRHARLSSPVEAPLASARMLYEMAKLNDEWPGEDYEGSSIRAALKGFFNNGVCSEDLAPYREGERNWYLNKHQAEDARKVGLGAYFRLRPQIIDYHAALNEAGVIYASAMVHRGWQRPRRGDIAPSNVTEGGHAFIIVGYDDKGFLIQNSWGEQWGGFGGRPGIARWRYEDWSANIMDAWVLRLNVPTPDSFDLTVQSPEDAGRSLLGSPTTKAPRHEEIVGHIIHLDDGNLVETGKYPTPVASLQETANFLADEDATAGRDYKHLLFYAHGGLNDQNASANRV